MCILACQSPYGRVESEPQVISISSHTAAGLLLGVVRVWVAVHQPGAFSCADPACAHGRQDVQLTGSFTTALWLSRIPGASSSWLATAITGVSRFMRALTCAGSRA